MVFGTSLDVIIVLLFAILMTLQGMARVEPEGSDRAKSDTAKLSAASVERDDIARRQAETSRRSRLAIREITQARQKRETEGE